MKEFQATVLMEPVGKARARTIVRDGKARTYTPSKTAEAENFMRATIWKQQRKGEVYFPLTMPLSMELVFYLPKPKSAKRQYPTAPPDWDNLGKLASDAMEGDVYANDSQIVDVKLSKRYISDGELPRIYIRVRELEG